MMKKRNFILSFFLLLLGTLFAFAACGGEKTKELRINVPENTVLEAELGAYDIPKYDVVDSDGLIMAGYLVEVESVVGPDGKEVPVSYGKINVSVPGIYVITYSASGEGGKKCVPESGFWRSYSAYGKYGRRRAAEILHFRIYLQLAPIYDFRRPRYVQMLGQSIL